MSFEFTEVARANPLCIGLNPSANFLSLSFRANLGHAILLQVYSITLAILHSYLTSYVTPNKPHLISTHDEVGSTIIVVVTLCIMINVPTRDVPIWRRAYLAIAHLISCET